MKKIYLMILFLFLVSNAYAQCPNRGPVGPFGANQLSAQSAQAAALQRQQQILQYNHQRVNAQRSAQQQLQNTIVEAQQRLQLSQIQNRGNAQAMQQAQQQFQQTVQQAQAQYRQEIQRIQQIPQPF